MDYETFCEKFEAMKNAVAVNTHDESLCSDIQRVRVAAQEWKQYMCAVGNFRPMDFVTWSEKHDMDAVMKTVEEAKNFVLKLNVSLLETETAVVHNLKSKIT